MIEIERRFLCRIAEELPVRADRTITIEQGYLSGGRPAVRIRRMNGEYILSVKDGAGRVRREVETVLDPDIGAELLEIAGTRRVDKTRYVVGGWEIDVYEGKLAGLIVAEAELDQEDDPLPPAPRGLTLLREITDDVRLTNQRLALLGEAEAQALIRGKLSGA